MVAPPSTLSAQMPVESSSKTTSSTNGIEIPKELYSVKDGVPFVVPEINELFANYETMWEQPSMTGYMNIAWYYAEVYGSSYFW